MTRTSQNIKEFSSPAKTSPGSPTLPFQGQRFPLSSDGKSLPIKVPNLPLNYILHNFFLGDRSFCISVSPTRHILFEFGGNVLCSDGLSARQGSNSDEIQLRIDPVHGDLDEEISGLHSQVRRLKSVRFPISFAAGMLTVGFGIHYLTSKGKFSNLSNGFILVWWHNSQNCT